MPRTGDPHALLARALAEGRQEAARIGADCLAMAGDGPAWVVRAERQALEAERASRRARARYEALIDAWLAEVELSR